MNVPQMYKVKRTEKENPYVTTIVLDCNIKAKPGQFVMVWVPGTDEKPMSVRSSGDELVITVEAIGECTKKMTAVAPGEQLGIRGPYGKPFRLEKDSIMVGGGVGMPPMANLYDTLGSGILLQGARTKDRLMFTNRYKAMRISTDDGSQGHKGLVTDLLEEEIAKKKPKMVYACGPELMMVKVHQICKEHGIAYQASLERYMRCGLGVCASCVCGKKLVCVDGPVFNSEELDDMEDFGRHALSKSAKKLTLKEYYERGHTK